MKLQVSNVILVITAVVLLVTVLVGSAFLSAVVGVILGVILKDRIPSEWITKLNKNLSSLKF